MKQIVNIPVANGITGPISPVYGCPVAALIVGLSPFGSGEGYEKSLDSRSEVVRVNYKARDLLDVAHVSDGDRSDSGFTTTVIVVELVV